VGFAVLYRIGLLVYSTELGSTHLKKENGQILPPSPLVLPTPPLLM